MLTDLLKYGLTLQAEIVAMVAEEVHHRAEDFVRKNADEGYEAYLNSLVGNLEKTVDTLAKPVDTALNGFYQMTGAAPGSLPTISGVMDHIKGLRKQA
jgi:hypothetical protein